MSTAPRRRPPAGRSSADRHEHLPVVRSIGRHDTGDAA